jgi:hypothetical protein
MSVSVGVLWELAEYIANQTLVEPFYRWFKIRAYFMGDMEDTVLDFVMDTVGSASFYLVSMKKKSPLNSTS